jgi:hypothetical protein
VIAISPPSCLTFEAEASKKKSTNIILKELKLHNSIHISTLIVQNTKGSPHCVARAHPCLFLLLPHMIDYDGGVHAIATSSTSSASGSHDEMEDDAPSIIDAVESNPNTNTEVEQANIMEGRLKRKQSLEALVTTGCGGGRKKQRIVDAFYGTLWPLLEEADWKMVSARLRVIMVFGLLVRTCVS